MFSFSQQATLDISIWLRGFQVKLLYNFGVIVFVSKSLLGIEGQKKHEKFAIFTRKLLTHARITDVSNVAYYYE